jgi:hypothetical protein
MFRKLIKSLLIVPFVLTVAYGQVWRTPCFDSTKHYVKDICIVIDSCGKEYTLWRKMQYQLVTTTEFDFNKKNWITKSVFNNVLDMKYSLEDLILIDSIYFPEKYLIEKCTLDITCLGTLKSVYGLKKTIDHLKKYGRNYQNCSLALEMTLINETRIKQDLLFRIY